MSSAPQEPPTDAGHRVFLALWSAAIAARCTAIAWSPLALNCDASMYLEVGRALREGAVPYVDVIELNPPLIWYLNVVPVGVAEVTGLHPIASLQLCFVGVAALASIALWTVLRRLTEATAGTAVVAVVPLLSLFITGEAFGQREHLYGIVLLPLLALRVARWRGVALPSFWAMGIGVAAAVGILLKPPHFLPALVVTELAWMVRHVRRGGTARDLASRAVDPEVPAMAMVAAAYAAHWAALPAASWQVFRHEQLPLIVEGYGAFYNPWFYVVYMLVYAMADSVAFLGAALYMLQDRPGPRRDLVVAATLTAASAAVVFLAQRKGWAYHGIPANLAGYLAFATVVGGWLDEGGGRLVGRLRRVHPAVAVTSGLAVSGVALLLVDPHVEVGALEGPAAAAVALSDEGDDVVVMATRVDWIFPAVLQANRRIGSRYPWAYPIALLYHEAVPDPSAPHGYRVRPERAEAEARYLDHLTEDLRARRPKVVLVDDRDTCWVCPRGMSMVAYLEGTAFGAELRDHYEPVVWDDPRPVDEDDPPPPFRVYRRRGD